MSAGELSIFEIVYVRLVEFFFIFKFSPTTVLEMSSTILLFLALSAQYDAYSTAYARSPYWKQQEF